MGIRREAPVGLGAMLIPWGEWAGLYAGFCPGA